MHDRTGIRPTDGSGGAWTTLAFVSSLSITGPVKVLLRFLSDARAEGHTVVVCNIIADGDDDSLLVHAARDLGVAVTTLRRKSGRYLRLLREAEAVYAACVNPIVETHSFLPTLVGLYLKVRHRVPWVCYLHGTTRENRMVRLYHVLDSWMQRAADRVIVVAENQRRLIMGGRNRTRVRVIHNGVDLATPAPMSADTSPLWRRFGIDEKASQVVVVGRFSREKGYDVFVDAFALVVRSLSAHAFLVGDGILRAQIQSRVRNLGIDAMVTFVGFTETPGDFLSQADCVVLPSRSEGIPNAVLEALALRRPVVATAVGGVPEIIRGDIDGVLVAPESPEALARGIIRVLTDVGLARNLAESGFRRVATEFTPAGRYDKIARLYEEVFALKR